jgi:ATP-dependent Clp protease, protease subunit
MPYGIEVINKTPDEADVTIYGYITDEKWFDEDVTPKDFKATMDKLKTAKKVNVLINSGGGGVFAGMAIYNILRSHPAETIGKVQGVAASIASVILQGCNTRIVPKSGYVMIHNPMASAFGDAAEMRKIADALEKFKDGIVSTYTDRTKVNEKEIRSLMDAETWMTGEEAVVFGFADVMDDVNAVNAIVREDGKAIINGQEIDPSRFRSFPKDKISKENAKQHEDIGKNTPVNEVPDYSYFEKTIEYNS